MEPIINDPVLLQEFLIESEELLQAAQREARGRADVVGQAHVRNVVEVRGQTAAGDEHVIDVGGGG